MSQCMPSADEDTPVLHVSMTGRGEDAMRMDKRLHCAGRALGVRIDLDWKADRHGEPRVSIGDEVLVDHLVDTTELEALLRPYLKPIKQHR